jgi:hypothetical protein
MKKVNNYGGRTRHKSESNYRPQKLLITRSNATKQLCNFTLARKKREGEGEGEEKVGDVDFSVDEIIWHSRSITFFACS